MCVGPVSPDTITDAPRASATTSATDVCGERIAAPAGGRHDVFREIEFARPPEHDGFQISSLA